MPHYESEITRFLRQLLAENPQIAQDQLYGRSLLWDQPPRRPEDQRQAQLGRVAKQPYEYYSPPKSQNL